MLLNEKILEIVLSKISLNIGWQSMSQQSMKVLQTLLIRYIQDIGKTSMSYANNFNRSEVLFNDILLTFQQMNFNINELETYLNEVDSVAYNKEGCSSIPFYPCQPPKGYSRLYFPNNQEAETRPEYFDKWLPSLHYGDQEKDNLNESNEDNSKKENSQDKNSVTSEEKKDDLSKPRMDDRIYLSSIYINAEGKVTGIGGKVGVIPDSKMPPKLDWESSDEEENVKKRKKLNDEDEDEDELKKKFKIEKQDAIKNKIPLKLKIKNQKLNKILKKPKQILPKKDKKMKKCKGFGSLSIKVSGLKSGTFTAMASPSLNSNSVFDSRKDKKLSDLMNNDEEMNVDNCIDAVIAKSAKQKREGKNDLNKKLTKIKKIRKKRVKNKRKENEIDEVIDDVIKTVMSKESESEEEGEIKSLYSFSDDGEDNQKSGEVDDKEAAKILVSLSEDCNKKYKKSKKLHPLKSSPSQPQSTFSNSCDEGFPKVAPGSTPLSPNSSNYNPFLSPLHSPHSSIPTPPLFSSKSDSKHNTSSSSAASTPAAKPPLKTLAEKKALPPIDETLLMKKERKKKEKKTEREGKKIKKSKKYVDDDSDDDNDDEEEYIDNGSLSPSSSTSTKLNIKTSKKESKKKKISTNENKVKLTSNKNKLKEKEKLKAKEREERKSKDEKKSDKKEKSKDQDKKEKRDKNEHKYNDASCVLITETIKQGEDNNREEAKEKVWICPGCKKEYDGNKPMIGCDGCDDWYHWHCVGIKEDPGEEESWFCERCIEKQKDIAGRFIKCQRTRSKHVKSNNDWACPVCRNTESKGETEPMIECDICDKWYHYSCVGLFEEPADSDPWYCSTCSPTKHKKKVKQAKPVKPKSDKAEKVEKKETKKDSSSSWFCLVCKKSNNSKPTICCDSCDQWFHWPCVGIIVPPKQSEAWFCDRCIQTQAKIIK